MTHLSVKVRTLRLTILNTNRYQCTISLHNNDIESKGRKVSFESKYIVQTKLFDRRKAKYHTQNTDQTDKFKNMIMISIVSLIEILRQYIY